MTVLSKVIIRLQGPNESRGYDTRCPAIAIVQAQGTPVNTADLVFVENGEGKAGVATNSLLQVFDESRQEGQLIGKYLQIVGMPQNGEFGTPKSPAAGGICLEAFQLSNAFEGGVAVDAFVTIEVDDGKRCMLVPLGPVAGWSTPATIEELESFGTISVRDGVRSVATL